MAKSWKEKLAAPKALPKVEVMDKPFGGAPAGAKLFIPTPMIVKEYIDAIPKGESRTIPDMRVDLADRNGADVTCPLTSGIFVRIAAEAALEEMAEGKLATEITPFWRIIDKKSPALKKLSCPPDFVLSHRKAEGLPE